MKKMWLFLLLILSGNGALFAQVTDAPDQGEPATRDTAVTEEKEVTATTQEKEIKATSGVVYSLSGIDYVSPDVRFTINASDEGSGVKNIWIIVDNASFGVYNQAINIPIEGKHIIAYKVEDQVGNISPVRNYEFVVDTTAPEVLVRTQEKGVYLGDSLYISSSNKLVLLAQDKLSGVKSIDYKMDNGAWMKYNGPIASGLTNGLHKLQFKATDNVGNVSAVKSFMVFVDNGSPVVSISVEPKLYTAGDRLFASPEAHFSLNGKDNETRVEYMVYSIDNAAPVQYSQAFRLAPGKHTIRAQAVDILGNKSAEVSMTIEIDGSAPQGDLIPAK